MARQALAVISYRAATLGIAIAIGGGCSSEGGGGEPPGVPPEQPGIEMDQNPQTGNPVAGQAGDQVPPTMVPSAMGSGGDPMVTPPVDPPSNMDPVDDPSAGDPSANDPMDDPSAGDPMDDPQPGAMATLPSPDEVGPYAVIEEENVGEGFENSIASNDQGDGLGCLGFISLFGQDDETSREYAMIPDGHDMALYTLYRPENLEEGVAYPALSWANGTCAHPIGYADMFRHIVSHGFIIVAAHSRYTGSGEAQVRGLDFLEAENENPESALYGHIDTAALGIFGHSQGSSSTAMAARDPRVASIVFMHGGTGNESAPALFLTSDLEASGVRRGYDSARVPAAYGKLENSDHITMMVEHERMAPEVTAWFRYILLEDDVARGWFAGADCLLCGDSEWDYEAKDLP